MIQNRYYQNDCIKAIYEYFSHSKGNPLCVLPTGTGKSVIIAQFIASAFKSFPHSRIMMLSHVKELIEQNYEKLRIVWPQAPCGMYSAGLNSRDVSTSIVFGGVQSVAKCIERSLREGDLRHFGRRDLLIVDEAHLISPDEDTTYRYVIDKLKAINPRLKVIGFTATPYRMKQGLLTEGDNVFTDICYDIGTREAFVRLVDEGYLCNLIPRRTKEQIDVSDVKITAGEYNLKSLQERVNINSVTDRAVKEIISLGQDRKAWLIFASGIENAECINKALNYYGIKSAVVHSKQKDEINAQILKAFKAGKIRCVVNNDKLTTGFDHPAIDLIGMLRATKSPGLWCQMLGRGLRVSEGKKNCLVLDFVGNTLALGPVNDIRIPGPKGAASSDAPVKICPKCETYNHASVRNCENCDYEFPAYTKIVREAPEKLIDYHEVERVFYTKHLKDGSAPSLKVTYVCKDSSSFAEYVSVEHLDKKVRKIAEKWWSARCKLPMPSTVDGIIPLLGSLRKPYRIRVQKDLKYPKVLSADF
jgi:DNA repair protein RadD